MDQPTMTYWRFLNVKGTNPNIVFSGWDNKTYLNDAHGMLEIPVNWIDGKPYYLGYPGTQCTDDGNILAVKGTGTPTIPTCPKAQSAWDKQVAGNHYTDMVIQPFVFSMANKLDPMQHTIVKYVTRFRQKNGIQDLEKARHTLDLLIEWEKKHATANT